MLIYPHGQLTQLGECLLDVEKVRGSSPLLPTTYPRKSEGIFFCLKQKKACRKTSVVGNIKRSEDIAHRISLNEYEVSFALSYGKRGGKYQAKQRYSQPKQEKRTQ